MLVGRESFVFAQRPQAYEASTELIAIADPDRQYSTTTYGD